MKELKVRLLCKLLHLLQRIVIPAKASTEINNLTKQSEMRLMRHQPKHDKISILPIHAVTGVWLIARLITHVPNVLHDFVLSFPGHFWTGEDNAQVPPKGVLFDLFANKVADAVGDAEQELSTGGDAC